MKRLAVTVALLGAVTATMLGGTGNAAPSSDQTFTLIEKNKEENFKLVDNPPRSPRGNRLSAGDTATLRQPLHSEAGPRVGAVDVACTATRGGSFAKARFVC